MKLHITLGTFTVEIESQGATSYYFRLGQREWYLNGLWLQHSKVNEPEGESEFIVGGWLFSDKRREAYRNRWAC
jgi:hypothetical protein